MEYWKKRNQSGTWRPTTKPEYCGRPPLSHGSSKNSLPLWEKKFCTSLISWKKLCETKRMMEGYPKIVEWHDSAGEKAFQDAKARFFANYHNLPCPVPLPDPEMYIDVVDYDVVIDPELMEDLYKLPPPPPERDLRLPDISEIEPTGWGDEEEDQIATNQLVQIQPSGWGFKKNQSASNQLMQIKPSGWSNEEEEIRWPNISDIEQTRWHAEEEDQNASNQLIQIKPSGSGNEESEIRWPDISDIVPTGWGDEEEDQNAANQSVQIKPSGCGDEEEDQIPTIYLSDQSIHVQPTGWVNRCDTENLTFAVTSTDPNFLKTSETMNNWGDYSCEHQKNKNDGYRRGQGGSGFGPNHTDGGRYQGRKKGNYYTDENKWGWKPMGSCGPVNHRRGNLQWRKSVS